MWFNTDRGWLNFSCSNDQKCVFTVGTLGEFDQNEGSDLFLFYRGEKIFKNLLLKPGIVGTN